jgi:hypothetical protein
MKDLIAARRPVLLLRRARLFARIHRPAQLVEGEAYDVDLARQRFEVLWGGDAVSVAHAQLIATYLPGTGEWLWGDNNPSTDPTASAEIAVRMDALTPLAPWRQQHSLAIDDAAFADDLADWISEQSGYEATYPANVGEAIAYLALSFTSHRGEPSVGPVVWCVGCGHLPRESTHQFVSGPGGRALCAGCADTPLTMLVERLADHPTLLDDSAAQEPPGHFNADYLCAFCESRRPRLFLPETAICWLCVAIIGDVLAPKT